MSETKAPENIGLFEMTDPSGHLEHMTRKEGFSFHWEGDPAEKAKILKTQWSAHKDKVDQLNFKLKEEGTDGDYVLVSRTPKAKESVSEPTEVAHPVEPPIVETE